MNLCRQIQSHDHCQKPNSTCAQIANMNTQRGPNTHETPTELRNVGFVSEQFTVHNTSTAAGATHIRTYATRAAKVLPSAPALAFNLRRRRYATSSSALRTASPLLCVSVRNACGHCFWRQKLRAKAAAPQPHQESKSITVTQLTRTSYKQRRQTAPIINCGCKRAPTIFPRLSPTIFPSRAAQSTHNSKLPSSTSALQMVPQNFALPFGAKRASGGVCNCNNGLSVTW